MRSATSIKLTKSSFILCVVSFVLFQVASAHSNDEFSVGGSVHNPLSLKRGNDTMKDELLILYNQIVSNTTNSTCDQLVNVTKEAFIYFFNETSTQTNGTWRTNVNARIVCTDLIGSFNKSLILYGQLRNRCPDEIYDKEFSRLQKSLYDTVKDYPCLLARRDCTGDDILCKPAEIFKHSGLRVPGINTVNTCFNAINHSCELKNTQAICQCSNGKCKLDLESNANRKPKSFDMSITELFADPYMRHFGYGDDTYNVSINQNELSSFWKTFPVIWEPQLIKNNGEPECPANSPNGTKIDVILHGEIRNCTKGFHCPKADGHIQRITFCKPGYYCKDSDGEPQKCPAGHYCPAGMWKPIKCQALSVCPEGAVVDTPFIGVISAIILLVIVIIAYRVARNREEVSWSMQAKDEGKTQKLFTKVRQDNEDENEHLEVEVDAATVMKDVEAHLNIKFFNLSVTIPPQDGKSEPKTIMSGVTGKFMSGKVTAVMGPSGSGKTTLISSLLGQISRSGGEVKINGEIEELTEYRKIIGFVPQDDIMLTTLTVREVLTHSAITRLPASWSKKDVQSQINAVLHLLDLARVQNTIIGDGTNRGISGGQRKRVNIGMELVMNPAMIILDEPTTGLDSSTALEVVRYLKLVATQGRTVVSIIHQPRYETFAMFDQVLMLAKGGRTVYEGKASRALEYFTQLSFHLPANTNPADFFMDAISGKVPRHGFPDFQPADLVKVWEETTSGQGPSAIQRSATTESVNLPIAPVNKDIRVAPNLVSQLIACTLRAFAQKYRQPSFTKTFLLIHLAIAFALGSGFAQGSRMFLPPFPEWLARFCPPVIRDLCEEQTLFDTAVVQSSFFVNLSVGACAIVVSVLTFGDELPVFWREYRSGANPVSYFIGKNIVDMFWIIYGSLFFTGVLVVMLRPITSFGEYFLVILSLEFTGYGMGYFMSVLFHKESAHVVGVVALFAFCVCSGISPQLSTVYESFSVARIFWDISFPRYIAEAAFVNVSHFSSFPFHSVVNFIRVSRSCTQSSTNLLLI
eukprot:TRINITY_DN9946_c0_g1_i2.p1 TRINITY_DN9946_c0_g1~~TRINITY_DN9946_c0_g1_i2.p1  ORF type:complete len:1032 (-),score=162.94 TRINITY_DN9946_c0_g1_i2:155-3250(-)